jgi:hypothetical protein
MSKPNNFLLFGLPGDDSRAAARRLDALFGISMQLTSRNGHFWYGEQGEEIHVEYNEDEEDGEKYFHRPQFSEFPLTLEVVDVADQDAYEKTILGDPELRAKRLMRAVWKRGPQGEVIRESYSPTGEVTAKVTTGPGGKLT